MKTVMLLPQTVMWLRLYSEIQGYTFRQTGRQLEDGRLEVDLDDQVYDALMRVHEDPDEAVRIILLTTGVGSA